MTPTLLAKIKSKAKQNMTTLLFFLSLSFTNFLNAQISPAWVKFSTPSNYANYDVKEVALGVDTLGNVYTAASMNDTLNNLDKAVLVKHNSAGVQQWIKFYDNNSLSYNGTYVTSLLVDKAGNSYVCGYGIHNGISAEDIMVIKYDNSGTQQWIKYWDGGQNQADYATSATFDATGNIIVAGYANDFGTTGDDVALVKWSTSGTQVWSYVYNNSASNGEDRALSVASDPVGNIFITGSTYGTNARNMITIKLNNSGINQWTKIMAHVSSGNDERGYSVAADALGNCYATGAVGDWITIKYDPAGNALWTSHYTLNALNADSRKKVMIDKNNNVIVTGDAFVSGGGHFSDLVTSKLDPSNGSLIWSVSIDNGGIDAFTDATYDASGNIYVGGYFDGPLGPDMSAMIITSAGGVIWNTTYSNPNRAAGTDYPYQVIVDKNLNFYMAGVSETRGTGSTDAVDVVTLKYNALVTGIKENSLSRIDLSIYPNPARDNLTVNIKNQDLLGATISIIDMVGEIVKEEKLVASTQHLDLVQLPRGLYLVRVVGSNTVATGKLIIE